MREKDLADDDTNVFQKSFINRHEHRPRELQSMCLAEFAATYVAHNNIRLNSLAPESEQYSIHACDAVVAKPVILTLQTCLRKEQTLVTFIVC